MIDKLVDQWLPDVSVEVELGYETEFKIKGMGEGMVYLDILDESRDFTKFEHTGNGKGILKLSPGVHLTVGSKYQILMYTN